MEKHRSGRSLEERRRDRVADDRPTKREISARDSLCEHDHVGLEPPSLSAEPPAETTKCADHLVGHEHNAGLAAELGQTFEIALWRRQYSPRPDNGLTND